MKTAAAEDRQRHASKALADGTTTTTTSTATSTSPTWISTTRTVLSVAVASVVFYHLFTLGYIISQYQAAASGPFGSTLAVTDAMSARFPSHFVVIQRLGALPFPNVAAKQYYEDQRDFFLQAARTFEVHPYWVNQNEAKDGMTFRQVVTERMRSMYRQFQENGLMDYRIEKDRCAQFDFFRRNGIAHPKIQKMWYSREQILDDVTSGSAIGDMMEHWPIFFKACHLTQRSSLGTFAISSVNELDDSNQKKQELIQWINDKWEYRSRDVDRPWQTEGDVLTDALTPSFLVQEPMINSKGLPQAGFKLDGQVSSGLVEIKVEVFWGKVYIMQLDAVTIILRNGEMEDYSTFMGGILHRPGKVTSTRVTWIRDGGYLDCVIQTAEFVAQAAHIEYVRVDIFLDEGNPNNCAVNEISLSSGYVYYGHEKYMAKLWAGPLQQKSYQLLNSTAPVYELTMEARMDDGSRSTSG